MPQTKIAAPSSMPEPYAYIVEQPAKCGVRFRYECEGRISSAIPGATSSSSKFTFPAISVVNYTGPVKVIVSCVTKHAPYRPHPHNLVGKKYCTQGICVAFFAESYCVFNNLGILCAKRKDVKERLRVREQLQVDPFGTGFNHRSHTFKLIDLNVVRLCFQVYLPDSTTGKFNQALEPIVSDEIYDKKAMSELAIAKLSHYSAPAKGGKSIIMLCDRVLKEDIQIRFYKNNRNGEIVWEKLAPFGVSDIHKHFAISFKVPSYPVPFDGEESAPVQVQLQRPSDGCTSEPITFYYTNKKNVSKSEPSALPQVTPLAAPNMDNSEPGPTNYEGESAFNSTSLPFEGNNASFTLNWGSSTAATGSLPYDDQNVPLKCEFDDYALPCDGAIFQNDFTSQFIDPQNSQAHSTGTATDHHAMAQFWNEEQLTFQQTTPMLLDISENIVRTENPNSNSFPFMPMNL